MLFCLVQLDATVSGSPYCTTAVLMESKCTLRGVAVSENNVNNAPWHCVFLCLHMQDKPRLLQGNFDAALSSLMLLQVAVRLGLSHLCTSCLN